MDAIKQRIDELESTLKVIYTWAKADMDRSKIPYAETMPLTLVPTHVVKLCEKTLLRGH